MCVCDKGVRCVISTLLCFCATPPPLGDRQGAVDGLADRCGAIVDKVNQRHQQQMQLTQARRPSSRCLFVCLSVCLFVCVSRTRSVVVDVAISAQGSRRRSTNTQHNTTRNIPSPFAARALRPSLERHIKKRCATSSLQRHTSTGARL